MEKNIQYDIVIIGAGPAGLYTAYGLLEKDPNLHIKIIEKGQIKDKRICPALAKHSKCTNCKICHIMSGLGGAGFQSDSKFPITNDFGGNLWEKIGREKSLEFQKKVDSINRKFYYDSIGYTDDLKIEWLENNKPEQSFPRLYSSKNSSYKKICTQHNLHLLDADIRHLGTDIGQVIYSKLYDYLVANGIEFEFNTEVDTIRKVEALINVDSISDRKYYWKINCLTDNKSDKLSNKKVLKANTVVVAAGRSGSEWVKKLCQDLNIPTRSNKVDLGIRFECPNEIWDHITKELYESKIIYKTKTYEDEVRTFCMNPSGEVVTENTNGLITVNGHAFEDKNKKTENTNFALLVSQSFTEPFDDSNEYGNAIVKLSNMLGGGVIVQRYGDLIRGKRSTKEHIKNNSVHPTLNTEPGDLSLVLPKRILDDILEMIEKLDHLVPGMTNDDNLLYGVEVKRYNMTVEVNENLEAVGYKNLYMIGDGSGWTHSLSQSSASGLYIAEKIVKS